MASGIENFTLRVDPLLSGPDREVLAFLIIDRILERTASGRDVSGERFARYNPNYREQRQERGLPTTPDLKLTGQMISSIQLLRHSQGSITIGVIRGSDAARKARWQQGGNPSIPERNFMGIDDAEAVGIEQMVIDSSPIVQAQRFLARADIIGKIAEQVVFDPFTILEAAEDSLQQRTLAAALEESAVAAAASARVGALGNLAAEVSQNLVLGESDG